MVSMDSSNEMQLSQYVISTDSIELPHITDRYSNLISRSFQQTFEKLGRVCIGIDSQIGAKLFHPLCIIILCRLDRELKELERKNSVLS